MIKIIDSEFSHAKAIGNGDLGIRPVNFEWYRGTKECEITVYTDRHIYGPLVPSKFNIAWLIEPKALNPFSYSYIQKNLDKFDYIITHDLETVNLSEKCILVPLAGCWIREEDHQIFPKSKGISIISSDKKITFGHYLRHEVISKVGNQIDLVCGRGYKPISNKIEALKEFRFSIAIENVKTDTFFTEKLIDCFITGTIPVYFGTNQIKYYFNENGIVQIDSLQDLEKIVNCLDEAFYQDRIDFIKENFELAKKWVIVEDYVYNKLFKLLMERL